MKYNLSYFSNYTNNKINKFTNINKEVNYEENNITKLNLIKNNTTLKSYPIKKKDKFNFIKISKNNFFTSSGIDISVINERLNYDILIMIFEQCELDPKPQGQNIRYTLRKTT